MLMKQLLVCTLFFVFTNCLAQQKGPEQAIIRFFDGLALLNDSLINEYTTSDFLLLEHGEVWNRDTLLRRLAPMKSRAFKRENEFKFFQVKKRGKTAWVAYDNKAFVTVDQRKRTLHWLESATLRYHKGRWRVALLHSTRIED